MDWCEGGRVEWLVLSLIGTKGRGGREVEKGGRGVYKEGHEKSSERERTGRREGNVITPFSVTRLKKSGAVRSME